MGQRPVSDGHGHAIALVQQGVRRAHQVSRGSIGKVLIDVQGGKEISADYVRIRLSLSGRFGPAEPPVPCPGHVSGVVGAMITFFLTASEQFFIAVVFSADTRTR